MLKPAIFILILGFCSVNANENENNNNNNNDNELFLSQETCTAENIKNSQLQFNSCSGVGVSCQQCRATLISQDWAITAASCVDWYQPGQVNKGVEISGLTDMNENKFQLCSDAENPIIIHPEFSNGLYYDIALIKINSNSLPISCISTDCQANSPQNLKTFANFYDCNRDQFYGVLDGTSICANNDELVEQIGFDNVYPGTPAFDDEGYFRGVFGWAGENQFKRGQPYVSLVRISSFMKWVAEMINGQGDSFGNMDFWLNGTNSKCIEGSGPTQSGLDSVGRDEQGSIVTIIKQKTGFIESPNYGKTEYPNNYKQTWQFNQKLFSKDANCLYYTAATNFMTVDFHFSDEMYLEGTSDKVCYDKLIFEYRVNPQDRIIKTEEVCGNIHKEFDKSFQASELNVTFVSDYSMAKRGFYAKYMIRYDKDCGYDEENNNNNNNEDFPSGARSGGSFEQKFSGEGRTQQISDDRFGFARHDPGEQDQTDGRAQEPENQVNAKIYWIIGSVTIVVIVIVVLATLLHVQTELKKVTIITQGVDGAGDCPAADSELGGVRSVKTVNSVEGFTREDVEIITEHVLSAIHNKSMSSIKSSPNKSSNNNNNITHQITTQYHSPQGDRFKKLSRKNAIQNIQDLHESSNLENQLNNNRNSPLARKQEFHDIQEIANKSDRSLTRKYANHDIHNISNNHDNISKERIGYDMFLTKTAENVKNHKIMTPRHSSPTVLSPRISSMSIPQKILRQKNRNIINHPDPAESVQSLKKFEQIEDHPEYVVKLKRSEARMSIHSLHEDESKLMRYPKYPSETTSRVETRNIPRLKRDSFSEETPKVHPRIVEEKISINANNLKSSKNSTRMNMDPFLIARPADAKTSVSIPNITPSDTEGTENQSNNSYNNNSHDDIINNSSPVVVNSIYSKTDQEQQQQSKNNNSVDQIIDNL